MYNKYIFTHRTWKVRDFKKENEVNIKHENSRILAIFKTFSCENSGFIFKLKNRNLQIRWVYLIICLSLTIYANIASQASNHLPPKGKVKLDKLIDIIKEKHVKTISEEELVKTAVNGILTSLDPYSHFYSNKDWQEINTYTSGEFSGIGIEMQIDQGKATVITPIANSPAENAGILPKDIIASINNTSVKGMSRQQILKNLLGKPNTKISLTVTRDGDLLHPIKLNMVRQKIQLPSIESKILSDKIFYLKIGAFYKNTSKLMQPIISELKNLQKENNLKGVIIDLRNNPGGLLDQAINIASIFIKKGNLVSIFSPKTKKNTQYFSKLHSFKLDTNIPIIVLINKGTASAAEILAGSLKDHKRAILIGEQSFGKGSVQEFIPLEKGEVIGLTTGLYKTPSGTIIEKAGIIPDIDISKDDYLQKIQNLKQTNTKINKKEIDDFFKIEDIINILIVLEKSEILKKKMEVVSSLKIRKYR